MAKKASLSVTEGVPVQVVESIAPAAVENVPTLFLALDAAGFEPQMDQDAKNFALIANKSPKVLGRNAQLIFQFDEIGAITKLMVL